MIFPLQSHHNLSMNNPPFFTDIDPGMVKQMVISWGNTDISWYMTIFHPFLLFNTTGMVSDLNPCDEFLLVSLQVKAFVLLRWDELPQEQCTCQGRGSAAGGFTAFDHRNHRGLYYLVKNGGLQAIFFELWARNVWMMIFLKHLLDISFKLWWLLHLLMLINGIVNGGSPSHRFQDWVMVWLGWFGVPSWLRKPPRTWELISFWAPNPAFLPPSPNLRPIN